MPFIDLIATSSFGSLLGMRHALEPDHLAAVSTLVSRERNGIKAAWLGVCWGVGHTFSLLVVGIALVVLRAQMPVRLSDAFECVVALMLIALGLRAILQAVRLGPDGPMHVHRHGGLVHTHAATDGHVHIGSWTLARRPLIVGAIHGLAGSGALTALVLTTLPTTAARLSYMALFGLGSTVGMAALSGLLGWPLARLGAHQAVVRSVTFLVGFLSTGFGLYWGYAAIRRLM
jgi:hypothetical protein